MSSKPKIKWPGDLVLRIFMISLAAAIASGRHVIGPTSAGLGDGYITIGHGILDPPQLFIQNKAADCSTKELSVCCLKNTIFEYPLTECVVCLCLVTFIPKVFPLLFLCTMSGNM